MYRPQSWRSSYAYDAIASYGMWCIWAVLMFYYHPRSEGAIVFSSVCLWPRLSVCLFVCQHDNFWTVRDIITKFSGNHAIVERSDIFNQTVNDGVAHSKNPRKCSYHVTLTLTLSTPWMQAYLESILWKFGSDPAICLREEAICAKVYRQTDGRTDDGRRAIALALELANKNGFIELRGWR